MMVPLMRTRDPTVRPPPSSMMISMRDPNIMAEGRSM